MASEMAMRLTSTAVVANVRRVGPVPSVAKALIVSPTSAKMDAVFHATTTCLMAMRSTSTVAAGSVQVALQVSSARRASNAYRINASMDAACRAQTA